MEAIMDKELVAVLPAFSRSIRPSLYQYLTQNKRVTSQDVLFMAGSPAAGKTELLDLLIEENRITNIVRIDADDFRWWFPYYSEANAAAYQKPASQMVELMYRYALRDGYQIVMDSTFASRDIAERNVQRALSAGYRVMINYFYFDPELAWRYAKLRARKVPLDILKQNFFKSRKTIEYMIEKYKDNITLNVYQRRPSPQNPHKFVVDYKPDVTLASWPDSHDYPYRDVSDLSHITL